MYIEMLIGFSCISEQRIQHLRDRIIVIESSWNEFAESEYYDIVRELNDSQLDRIAYGFPYQQKDILSHLRKLK